MISNKKILNAINEGISKGLNFSLDSEDDFEELYSKSNPNKKIQNLDKQVEKTFYSKQMQKLFDEEGPTKKNLNQAIAQHKKHNITINPHINDKYAFKRFIKDCIYEFGYNADLNWIITSDLKEMTELFVDTNFNGDISEWDVSNVKDMSWMFARTNFNGDISEWDVSNVKDMGYMFYNSEFNQPINNWDVSNVKDMRSMFRLSKFNQDISNWQIMKNCIILGIFANSKLKMDYRPIL